MVANRSSTGPSVGTGLLLPRYPRGPGEPWLWRADHSGAEGEPTRGVAKKVLTRQELEAEREEFCGGEAGGPLRLATCNVGGPVVWTRQGWSAQGWVPEPERPEASPRPSQPVTTTPVLAARDREQGRTRLVSACHRVTRVCVCVRTCVRPPAVLCWAGECLISSSHCPGPQASPSCCGLKVVCFLPGKKRMSGSQTGAEVGKQVGGALGISLPSWDPLCSTPIVPQPPKCQSKGPSATPTQMPPVTPGGSSRPLRLSAMESGPQKSPRSWLTPVRANNQLGHPKGEDAARGDGDHLVLAQVALASALTDGYGLRTGLWVVGPDVTGCWWQGSAHSASPARAPAHLQAHGSRKCKLAGALLLLGPGDLRLLLCLQHLGHDEHVIPTIPQLLQDFVLRPPQAPVVSGPMGSSQRCTLRSPPPATGRASVPWTSAFVAIGVGGGDTAEETKSSVDAQARDTHHSLPGAPDNVCEWVGCRKKRQGPVGTGGHLKTSGGAHPVGRVLTWLLSPSTPCRSQGSNLMSPL